MVTSGLVGGVEVIDCFGDLFSKVRKTGIAIADTGWCIDARISGRDKIVGVVLLISNIEEILLHLWR